MTTKERMKIYIESMDIAPYALEKAMGWGVGSFTKAKSISADRAQEFLAKFPELSAEWLFRGEGTMIKSQAPRDYDRLSNLVDTISLLQDTINTKSEALAIALDRIRQLELQLKK